MRILYVLLDFSQKYFLWIKCPNSYEYITPQYFLFLRFVLNRAHCLIARFVVIVVTDPQP